MSDDDRLPDDEPSAEDTTGEASTGGGPPSAPGQASPLAVLKTLGGPGRGYLSFPLRGYTLALDFPRRARTAELLSGLEKTTLEHGGRVYLAKDSLISAAGFEAMYPELPAFRQVLAEVDPGQRFQSDLGRRLGLRGGSR